MELRIIAANLQNSRQLDAAEKVLARALVIERGGDAGFGRHEGSALRDIVMRAILVCTSDPVRFPHQPMDGDQESWLAKFIVDTLADAVISGHTEPLPKQPQFPAWTGTNASAQQIAAHIRAVDEYATVDSETIGVTWAGGNVRLVVDTVPNTFHLRIGDRPAFDGERWTVIEAEPKAEATE